MLSRRCLAMSIIPIVTLVIVETIVSASAHGQTLVVNSLPGKAQQTFFHLPEGGAVMPLAAYRSLEVIDSTTGQLTGETFAERMTEYGFLDDPDAELPVGFGVVHLDFLGGLPGLNLGCAACHVGELHYQSNIGTTRLRVIGGPNLADVRRFSQDVYATLITTLESPAATLRLLGEMQRLRPEKVAALDPLAMRSSASLSADLSLDAAQGLALLRAELQYFIAQGRMPVSTPEGPGRLDAFGTLRFLVFPDESADLPFTAPVSVPHLWGIGSKKWLHWNNNTNSTQQRNIGQALGVGALQTHGGISNALLDNLHQLETIARQIAPPRWPADVFGPLQPDLVERGAALYQDRCAACHDAGVTDPKTGLVEYPMFSLGETGTDPNDALNFHQPVGSVPFATSLQERLRGIEQWYYNRRDPRHPVPLTTRVAWSGGLARLPAIWRDPLQDDIDAPVYAALPLAGVWATPPYLHNNSVPTLRDLLKPAAERPQVFMVGQREYDLVNVGYVQDVPVAEIPAHFRFDTSATGNSNAGHEGPMFGAEGLSDNDVVALLEFLKSL